MIYLPGVREDASCPMDFLVLPISSVSIMLSVEKESMNKFPVSFCKHFNLAVKIKL